MSNLTDDYFRAQGVAFAKGLDYFEDVMPKSRARSIRRASIEIHGFKWTERNFINHIIGVAGRQHRKYNMFPPDCKDQCRYRMKYTDLQLQANALRIEIFEPQDRCGWNVLPGRIGGHVDDYYPCCR